jgi:hypothetical protein
MLNLGKVTETRRRRTVFTALATIVATLAIVGVAQAETVTVGADLSAPSEPSICSQRFGRSCPLMTVSAVAPSSGARAPFDGTVTRWRIKDPSVTPGYALNVLRDNGDGTYTVTATTGPLTPTGNEIETFPSSLPIQAGEYLEMNLPNEGELASVEGESNTVGFTAAPKFGEIATKEIEATEHSVYCYNAEIEGASTTPPPVITPPFPTPELGVSPTSAAAPTLPAAADPHCVAPDLKGMKLKAAREKVRAAHCALGKNIKKPGVNNRNGKVVRQTVKPGTDLAAESVLRVALGQGR